MTPSPQNGDGERAGEILALCEAVKPMLAGHAPAVQGGVLAELTSLWLAGYWIPGEPDETGDLRESLLSMHLAAVRALVQINALKLGTGS